MLRFPSSFSNIGSYFIGLLFIGLGILLMSPYPSMILFEKGSEAYPLLYGKTQKNVASEIPWKRSEQLQRRAAAAEEETEEASAVLPSPLSMERASCRTLKRERCWRKSRSQRPSKARNCRTSSTRDLPARWREWPEEPEAYRRASGSRKEFGGRWRKKFKLISHLRNSSSTSFQPLISSHLTSQKKSIQRKNIVRQNIRILEKHSFNIKATGRAEIGPSVTKLWSLARCWCAGLAASHL